MRRIALNRDHSAASTSANCPQHLTHSLRFAGSCSANSKNMKPSPPRSRRVAIVLIVSLQVVAATASWAQTDRTPGDPEATRKALTALLAAANDPIPRTSSCHEGQGAYGQTGPATVKDFLAMRMAYLYAGSNVVEGRFEQAQQCTVSIRHAAGEDVASVVIFFKLRDGKARSSSLRCVITP